MHKTKILHITYDMRIGGTEMVIKNLINGRDKSHFDMSILCIESPLGPFAEELKNDGIQFFELSRTPGFDTQLFKEIRKIIKSNKIDLIHCHQYTPWVYGVIAAAFTKVKVIFTEHGRFYPDSSSWKRKLINPILNVFTDQVTAISKATKHALTEFENIPSKDIEVIYNGIKPLCADEQAVVKLRKELNIPDNLKVLGTVSRFDPIKNHKMMLTAFAQVLTEHPNTALLVVGDGDEKQNILDTINLLNIADKVILTGYVSKPATHIALMDIFLLSSLSEGTSMTLLEAMSIGKPCVVTDAGGNPEVVEHHCTGLVSKNADAHDFAQSVCRLLGDKNLYAKMQDESVIRFSTQFKDTAMNMEYNRIYLKSVTK